MSLVILCLLFSFVDYVPVKGEIIWYLSLTAWLKLMVVLPAKTLTEGGMPGLWLLPESLEELGLTFKAS